MGMRAAGTAAPAAVPAPSIAPGSSASGPMASTGTPILDPKKREVKGQVAMHAIITGYEVASHLAATLAASPDKVEETLHRLAGEVAAKVESYTFKGE